MSDLYGVLEVISAYPVHIMMFVGCILLLVLVLPKRKRQPKHLPISPESSIKKTLFPQSEEHLITEKISENKMSSLKQNSSFTKLSKFMLLVPIILMALQLLFVIGMIIMTFQKN